jgi:hypothetical protein
MKLRTLIKLGERLTILPALAVSSTMVTAFADSWRTAALATVAAGLVTVTRIRFAARVAVGLLLVVTVISLGGQGPARSAPVASTDRTESHIHQQTTKGGQDAELHLARRRRR